jgi:hypothetical protein
MNVRLPSFLEDAAHRSHSYLQGLLSGFSPTRQAIFTHCPGRHTAHPSPKMSWRCLRYPSCRPRNALLANGLQTIVFPSDTYPGRLHNKCIAAATPYPLPVGSELLQGLGFMGFALEGLRIT